MRGVVNGKSASNVWEERGRGVHSEIEPRGFVLSKADRFADRLSGTTLVLQTYLRIYMDTNMK